MITDLNQDLKDQDYIMTFELAPNNFVIFSKFGTSNNVVNI